MKPMNNISQFDLDIIKFAGSLNYNLLTLHATDRELLCGREPKRPCFDIEFIGICGKLSSKPTLITKRLIIRKSWDNDENSYRYLCLLSWQTAIENTILTDLPQVDTKFYVCDLNSDDFNYNESMKVALSEILAADTNFKRASCTAFASLINTPTDLTMLEKLSAPY